MLLTANGLLSALPLHAHSDINARLSVVEIPQGSVIYYPGQKLEHVFFLFEGIATMVWPTAVRAVDVAMIGAEGMLGCAVSFGAPKTLFRTLARSDVVAARLRCEDFESLTRRLPELQTGMVQFAASLTAQIAETAFANARLTVEQRVARWVFRASECVKMRTVRITHDELADAVGCRRAGVTVAIHMLEGVGIIRARRNEISILDRGRLILAFQKPSADGELDEAESNAANGTTL
jgi:CRP-like cAMP-binding protein